MYFLSIEPDKLTRKIPNLFSCLKDPIDANKFLMKIMPSKKEQNMLTSFPKETRRGILLLLLVQLYSSLL
jgi:hypothetical protein